LLYYLPEGVERPNKELRKEMRKDPNRVSIEKPANILFAVCREKNDRRMPERVLTKNISSGGLCVVSDIEVKKGTVLAAEIIFDAAGLGRLKAYCEAMWSKQTGENGQYEVGLQFIGLKDSESKNLKEFIHSYN
jgi:hypothetical protein